MISSLVDLILEPVKVVAAARKLCFFKVLRKTSVKKHILKSRGADFLNLARREYDGFLR